LSEETKISTVETREEASAVATINVWRMLRRFGRRRGALFGLGVLAVLVLATILAPYLTAHNPGEPNMTNRLAPPGGEHLFGTDNLGRDLFARTLFGARVSLTVGPLATAIALAIGLVVGCISGFYGGTVDLVLQRIVDVVMCMPAIFLILVIIAFVGPAISTTILVIGLVYWTAPSRIIRAEFLAMRDRDFVEAAKAVGMNEFRIIWRHILPNALPPLIVQTSLFIAQAILIEAALSYLGLGAQPPVPSWGNIMTDGGRVLHRAWWVATFPGIGLFLTVLSLNLVGDGLRDALDPKQQ